MKMFLPLLCFLITSLAWADQLRFLRDDRDALQARVDIIQQAKKEILVEYFSVWNDDQSIGGIALLMEAAKRGIKVKIIVDALSNTVPKKTYAALLSEGKDADGNQNLEIQAYNPLSFNLFKATHRDHAKMIIVDGEVIITGGRNVGDKYFGINRTRNFSDLDLMAKGEIAFLARQNFLETWESKTTKKPSLGNYAEQNLKENACDRYSYGDVQKRDCESRREYHVRQVKREVVRIHDILKEILTPEDDDIVTAGTGKDWFEGAFELDGLKFLSHGTSQLVSRETAYMNKPLLETIAGAEREVNIISPYLIPTIELMEVFADLRAKNVRIRIITNSLRSTDNLFAQAGYRDSKPALVDLGIEIYEYNGPDTIHAKTAVVDEKIVFIGTYNIDPRSAFLNREIGVLVLDEHRIGFSDQLTQIIEDFRVNSTLVGKDGMNHNEETELSGVSKFKRAMLKSIKFILPLIRNQL